MKTVERICITVPIDVYRQIKALKKKQRVNISAIALQAFVSFVNGDSTMAENIRLREENERLKEVIRKARSVLESN